MYCPKNKVCPLGTGTVNIKNETNFPYPEFPQNCPPGYECPEGTGA